MPTDNNTRIQEDDTLYTNITQTDTLQDCITADNTLHTCMSSCDTLNELEQSDDSFGEATHSIHCVTVHNAEHGDTMSDGAEDCENNPMSYRDYNTDDNTCNDKTTDKLDKSDSKNVNDIESISKNESVDIDSRPFISQDSIDSAVPSTSQCFIDVREGNSI